MAISSFAKTSSTSTLTATWSECPGEYEVHSNGDSLSNFGETQTTQSTQPHKEAMESKRILNTTECMGDCTLRVITALRDSPEQGEPHPTEKTAAMPVVAISLEDVQLISTVHSRQRTTIHRP